MQYATYDTENWKIAVDNLNLSMFKYNLVTPHYTFSMINTHEAKLTVTSLSQLGENAWMEICLMFFKNFQSDWFEVLNSL